MQGTKYNRLLFRLSPLMRRTAGTESGLLQEKRLFPTVQTQGLKVCNRNGKTEFLDLKLLPTPTASDWLDGIKICNKSPKLQETPKLADFAVSNMLPTPQAADGYKTTKAGKQDNLNKTFQTGGTSQLNPLFAGEMMGFPEGWLVLPFLDGEENQSKPSEMQ
jgi:hypothetical protein